MASPVHVFREEELRQAAKRPLFSNPVPRQQKETYPNVHNSAAKSKTSSAYVGSTKIMLPPDTVREDKREWEKVQIPANRPADKVANEQLVPISAFSKIGQLAFQGYKSLNRVQSFVYS